MSLGSPLQTRWLTDSLAYTGVELRPHFLLEKLGVEGSALVAFAGPCRVATEHLVDWEDRLNHDRIEAREMVHFIGEFFGISLREGVALQRLLMAIAGERLGELIPGEPVKRVGDDLFVKGRKLSVSIATVSPVSVLIHAGVNIDPTGAPVPAIGLQELGVDSVAWTRSVLESFGEELSSLHRACSKVRPVV